MAGRGRGRANTLPAWMTKQGLSAPQPVEAPPAPPVSRSPPRNGQFDDAPERAPRPPERKHRDEFVTGSKRSRDRYSDRNSSDLRERVSVHATRSRSRSRDRGSGRDRERDRSTRRSESRGDRRREESSRRGSSPRGRSRSRDRRDDRSVSRRGGGERYEDRGYGGGTTRGPRDDDYRRNEGRVLRRDDEAMERGYRRHSSNGHDDRTSRRYTSDYRP